MTEWNDDMADEWMDAWNVLTDFTKLSLNESLEYIRLVKPLGMTPEVKAAFALLSKGK